MPPKITKFNCQSCQGLRISILGGGGGGGGGEFYYYGKGWGGGGEGRKFISLGILYKNMQIKRLPAMNITKVQFLLLIRIQHLQLSDKVVHGWCS